MSQTSFDDDELFTEATADIQSEIEESLTAATAALPSHADLVEHDTETTVAALESVEETIDIDAAEAAVADVKKTFLLGQRADAFESEYATETEATINESEERSPHLERLLRQVKRYQYQTTRPTIVAKWLFPPRPVELRV